MSAGFDRRGLSNNAASSPGPKREVRPTLTEGIASEPASRGAILTRSEAKASGYTGSVCDICGSARMRVAGHCMVCEECGTTTGCS